MTPRAAKALQEIIAAALAGERCPQTQREGRGTLQVGATTELSRGGYIRIEIYRQNYRVVTILKGEHAGLSTAPYPDPKAKPHKTITTYAPAHPLGREQQKIAP